ncbi:MAG TPA: pantoate--beta-alanine ligase [Anaerolineales bacterium]|nr:pantoate--beta-alanine ligase [Anaerolineales bacterium]
MSRQMMIATMLEELASSLRLLDHPLGFVPTMGYLHEGHLSLARRAREECKSVAASIFVNPTQFGPNEDLSKYPRDLKRDLGMLEEVGVDLVWTPTPEIMYPVGFQTWVEVQEVSQGLEGAQRAGHFRGVATVVTKLFNAVRPDKAYFGQKDAQQAAVIRRMTEDLNFPIQIVVCPIIREMDGLAMSSRNVYLDEKQRRAASVLYRALSEAKGAYDDGEKDAGKLRDIMKQTLAGESLAQVQYVSCADTETLQEVDKVTGRALLSMAVFFGKTRLIDNMVLE